MRQVENLSMFLFCRGAGHRVQLYKVSVNIILVFTFSWRPYYFSKIYYKLNLMNIHVTCVAGENQEDNQL